MEKKLDQHIIDKLRKIEALTKSPNENEAANATSLLNELLGKYNLTIDQVYKPETDYFFFHATKRHHKTLLVQIIAKVLNSDEWCYFKASSKLDYRRILNGEKKKSRNWMMLELTHLQYVKISEMYDIYKRELETEIKTTISAFIAINQIWSDSPSVHSSEMSEAEMTAILKRMQSTDVTIINPSIESSVN